MSIQIDMFSNEIEFEGIKLTVNSFSQKKHILNVMPIFLEEQPATYHLLKNVIHKKIKKNNSLVLDVGCGSGFWSIIIKKKYPNSDVFAIDKNNNAIEFSKKNASINSVKINLKNEEYHLDSFPEKSFDLIILTPPYHLYPEEIESNIPLFARGGSNGQVEFKSQLNIAKFHLKKDGIIIFNMMCIGDTQGPEYISFIKTLFENKISLEITNIFPPIKTSYFLNKVYQNNYNTAASFISSISNSKPLLYYTCGWLSHYPGVKIQIKESLLDLNRDWDDRIKLHQHINDFFA